jgi:hypothetical protein
MLHMDGADGSTTFTDKSASAHAVTPQADAQIDTAQSKFGGASCLLDGTGDYLSIGDHADWAFGAGDFTVDFWFKLNDTSDNRPFFRQYANSNNYINFTKTNIDKILIDVASGGFSIANYYTEALSWDTTSWHHLALVRYGTSILIFLDGQSQSLTAVQAVGSSSFPDVAAAFTIGVWGGYYLNGWIDEFRISKGIARWTGNFTPPTSAYVSPNDREYSAELVCPIPTMAGSFDNDHGEPYSCDITFPGLVIDSTLSLATGYRVELTLPPIASDGTYIKGNCFSAELSLPLLTVDAESDGGTAFSAELDIPIFVTDGNMGGVNSFSSEITFPAMILEASMMSVLSESFFGIVQNLHTMSITSYDGFNFNSLCKFNGQYLGANKNGISILDGDSDDGVAIDCDIVTGMTDGNSAWLKRITYAYLAMSSEKGVSLSLTADDEHNEVSEDVIDTDMKMHTIKVKTSKGRKGRYWTVRVQNLDGAHIDLDSIELVPEVLSRRV